MSEPAAAPEALNLKQEFPAVSTAEWEAAIRADLKGADYDKRLVWHTPEGIAVRPYYRRQDLDAKAAGVRAGRGWEAADAVAIAADAIRGDHLHEAGATAVQELAYALAEGVERLAAGVSAESIEFVFSVGSTYFMEIAKLRAARLLWAQAVAAFGMENADAARMRLFARTSRRDKSLYDRYSNLLRATSEAMSAAIGGCDRLMVEPFGFDPHLALNVQRILEHEAHLDAAADPAGGSYYIEALTDAVAREAWKLFQQVEAEGGYAKARESGSIRRAVAQSRAALEKAVASRRQTLVGVNNYPDLKEKTSDAAAPRDADTRDLPGYRLAEPFERIRARTARHAARTGRYPRVLLLTGSDLKMRMARANFSLNFFGCAGFDIVESGTCEGSDADLIVLCSSDAEYPALAHSVCPKVKVPVIVAGNPTEHLEELRQAGVAGFVHLGSNAVETLAFWQDRLGMEA